MSLVSTGRNDSACRTIDQLSTFLRTSLDSDPLQPVSLRKEIETLKLYLEIEQTRFVDRLKLEFDVAPAALDVKVPSLLLQPLAENAVKHAIAPSVDGGSIRVTAAVKNEWLEVAVEDSGPGIDDLENAVPVAGGVGWRNTRDRLRTIYGDQYQIVLEHAEPSGLRVVLRVPLERQAGASEAQAAEPAYG